jgi:hypothetical protein
MLTQVLFLKRNCRSSCEFTHNGPGSVVMSSLVITDPQMMEELNQILALKVLMFTLVTF